MSSSSMPLIHAALTMKPVSPMLLRIIAGSAEQMLADSQRETTEAAAAAQQNHDASKLQLTTTTGVTLDQRA